MENHESIGNQTTEQSGIFFKTPSLGSVQSYVTSRKDYWFICKQVTSNRLVEALHQGYENLHHFILKNGDGKALHTLLQETIAQKHIHHNLLIPEVVCDKIVAMDVLARMDGKQFFQSSDWIEQLTFIHATDLITNIREKDGIQTKTPEQIARERRQETAKKQWLAELSKLKGELASARQDLGSCPLNAKAAKAAKVRHLEEEIVKLEKSGQPLNSIHWVDGKN